MIFEQFLLDPDGHAKDWLVGIMTPKEKDSLPEWKEKLQRCSKVLGVEINTMRQWGYRDKENQQAYLYRAIILSICMKDNRILREWAEMAGFELHPRGTGKEADKLRTEIQEIKRVLGVENE